MFVHLLRFYYTTTFLIINWGLLINFKTIFLPVFDYNKFLIKNLILNYSTNKLLIYWNFWLAHVLFIYITIALIFLVLLNLNN